MNPEDDITDGLEEFLHDLEQGTPIKVTQVQRVQTPDGPMHLRRHTLLCTGNDPIIPDENQENGDEDVQRGSDSQ